MKKFEMGKQYSMAMTTNDHVSVFTVVKRTNKFVTFERLGKEIKCKLQDFSTKEEIVMIKENELGALNEIA